MPVGVMRSQINKIVATTTMKGLHAVVPSTLEVTRNSGERPVQITMTHHDYPDFDGAIHLDVDDTFDFIDALTELARQIEGE